jgi:hypothetical protein
LTSSKKICTNDHDIALRYWKRSSTHKGPAPACAPESIAAVASGTLQGLCTAQEAPANPSGQIEQAPTETFPNKAVGEGQANANAASAAELSPAEGLTVCSHSQSSGEYHGEGRAAEAAASRRQFSLACIMAFDMWPNAMTESPLSPRPL